jgi:hypothetical protein
MDILTTILGVIILVGIVSTGIGIYAISKITNDFLYHRCNKK